MTRIGKISVAVLSFVTLAFSASSAFACGGEGKDKKDTKNPSALDSTQLCGGEHKDNKDAKNPSVSGAAQDLCGGEGQDKKDTKNPSALCGGEGQDKKDTKNPSVRRVSPEMSLVWR